MSACAGDLDSRQISDVALQSYKKNYKKNYIIFAVEANKLNIKNLNDSLSKC